MQSSDDKNKKKKDTPKLTLTQDEKSGKPRSEREKSKRVASNLISTDLPFNSARKGRQDLMSTEGKVQSNSIPIRSKRDKHRSVPAQTRRSSADSPIKLSVEEDKVAKKIEKPSDSIIFSHTKSQPHINSKVPKLDLTNSTLSKTIVEEVEVNANQPVRKIDKEESIWDKIMEFQHGHHSIILPSDDDEIRELLEKEINRKQFVQFAQKQTINNFEKRYQVEIGALTVGKILTNFPEVLELFKEQGMLGFTEQDIKCFEKLRNTNNEFKDFKKDIVELLSSKSKSASTYYRRHIESMRKLLRYYTPANSEYVMKLIGNIKYRDLIANSVYMVTSVARFILKQYSDELKENALRLEGTYQETEKLLRLLVKRKIILRASEDKFKTTADSQALIFVILRVWRDVFKITNAPSTNGQKHDSNIKGIKDIHPVKALEYTLNMFIALSKHMLDLKKIDPSFYYDTKFSDAISHEFAILIANNLKSRSLTGAMYEAMGSSSAGNNANSSVNARTFKYKLDLIHKIMYEAQGSGFEGRDVLREDYKYIENDARIKDSIESVVEELTFGRKFILDKAFTKVLKVQDNGKFVVDEKKGDGSYAEDVELSAIMNSISLAIASEAGIKINKTELKYLLIAKTLITLLASYLLNTMILKKWFSAPMQILINLHGIDYLSSYLQYFIDLKEEQAKAEYNKYNEIDKEFNNTIELLFEQELVYPILDDNTGIEHIFCEPSIKVYLGIIAEAFKYTEIELNNLSPQDISALAKSMFNELCVYSIRQPDKKPYNLVLNKKNINEIAEGLGGAMLAHLEKKEEGQYTAKTSPEGLSRQFRSLLSPYMKNLQVELSSSDSNSSSLSDSLDDSIKESDQPKPDITTKPILNTNADSASKPVISTFSECNRVASVTKLHIKQSTNPIIELSSTSRQKIEKIESPKISPNKIGFMHNNGWVNSVTSKAESPRAISNADTNIRKSGDSITHSISARRTVDHTNNPVGKKDSGSPIVARRSLDGGSRVPRKFINSSDGTEVSRRFINSSDGTEIAK